jgi:hypothetical protein
MGLGVLGAVTYRMAGQTHIGKTLQMVSSILDETLEKVSCYSGDEVDKGRDLLYGRSL